MFRQLPEHYSQPSFTCTMKFALFLVAFLFLQIASSGQCRYNLKCISNKNNLEVNGKVSPVNLEAEISIIDDTVSIKHEILGTLVKYKFRILETDCSAWKKENRTGLIIISVEQVGSAKPYLGKLFVEKKNQSQKIVTLLDSVEGKYKLDYDISEFIEL